MDRLEEIKHRAERFSEGKLGSALSPKESLERGMDFAQLTAEDIPYLLQRVQTLEAENLRLRRKINQIDDAVEAMHYEMEDGSLPLSAKRRLEDILIGTYSKHLE